MADISFETINWMLLAPLIFVQLILIVVAVIDWLKVEKTNGPKWLWLVVILFLSIIGPILYFIVGRRDS